jgi:hypothetical protein
MKINQKLLSTTGIGGLIILMGWRGFDRRWFTNNRSSTTITCRYMMYACGDCYPQWNIDSIFAAENDMRELINKDVYVEYKDRNVEESLPDTIAKCLICYNFYFTGRFKKTLSGRIKFIADTFHNKMNRIDCCN